MATFSLFFVFMLLLPMAKKNEHRINEEASDFDTSSSNSTNSQSKPDNIRPKKKKSSSDPQEDRTVPNKSKLMRNQAECQPETSQSNNYSFAQPHVSDTGAQPLIVSAWSGTFCFGRDPSKYSRLDWLSAYVSSKACGSVYEYAVRFEPVLPFEMLHKSLIWPKSFVKPKPTNENIALYFFPALMQIQGGYDYLIYEMVRNDLALRAFVGGVELLVFTSMDLPQQIWRFQGKLYLWGVLRGRPAPSLYQQ